MSCMTATVRASISYTELSIFNLKHIHQDTAELKVVEYLYSYLSAAKSALDEFWNVPMADYCGISFPFFLHLARAILVVLRLSTISYPGWDTALVQSAVNLEQALDRIISNMQQARAEEGEEAKDGFLDRATGIFLKLRSAYMERLRANCQELTSNKGGAHAMSEGSFQLPALNDVDVWSSDDSTSGLFEELMNFPFELYN